MSRAHNAPHGKRDKITGLESSERHEIAAGFFTSACRWSSLDTRLSGSLFSPSQMFFCLCAHVCEGGRRRAGWFPPCSADLLATLGQVIPVIAAKAARRPNECLRRRQGAATCICLQASRQKNNTKLELDSRLDPIYVVAIFLQRHTQGWKLRLYVLKMYLCNFTASQVISN